MNRAKAETQKTLLSCNWSCTVNKNLWL